MRSVEIERHNLEPLNTGRTNKRITIYHTIINRHLMLLIGSILQLVLSHTWHLNSKAFITIHTGHTYSLYTVTIKYCNSLHSNMATIIQPEKCLPIVSTPIFLFRECGPMHHATKTRRNMRYWFPTKRKRFYKQDN